MGEDGLEVSVTRAEAAADRVTVEGERGNEVDRLRPEREVHAPVHYSVDRLVGDAGDAGVVLD